MTRVATADSKPLSDQDHASRISALADQCVQCGLCLPQCPTYRVGRSEAESPRGRIALARALAPGELPDPDSAQTHLDQCLACGSCERACPSHVQYGALLHEIRVLRPVSATWVQRLRPW